MTTRKRTTGFSSKEESSLVESVSPEETTDTAPEVKKETPFIEQEIAPTPDLGTRFIEEPTPVAVAKEEEEPQKPTILGKVPPRRHPRNTPKFSRSK